MTKQAILLSWSSGKDSAWALHKLRLDPRFEVRGLLTSINSTNQRVAMHAVRRELLEAQARSVGLPLTVVELPWPCSNEQYQQAMAEAVDRACSADIEGIAFGDLFLEDVRSYRERQLDGSGLSAHFPLWGSDTTQLAHEMIEAGLQARLTCVDLRHCPASLLGRRFDSTLLNDLGDDVDPCGEHGEFHSFTFDGPVFEDPVPVHVGEVVERDGFGYRDLLPTIGAELQ